MVDALFGLMWPIRIEPLIFHIAETVCQ